MECAGELEFNHDDTTVSVSGRRLGSGSAVKTTFSGPLKMTGANAMLNLSKGSLMFSSNEDQEIGGRGMANNGELKFAPEEAAPAADGRRLQAAKDAETKFTGCVARA